MTSQLDSIAELLKFMGAVAVATGAMTWWRQGSEEEDAIVSQANDILIEGVSDANNVNKILKDTNVNIREQLTVEQIIDMNDERNLRRWKWRN